MSFFADNYATDPGEAFLPPRLHHHNQTFAPRLSPTCVLGGGGGTALIPGTDTWNRLNTRRCELIDKEIDAQLSPEESAELELLQQQMVDAAERRYPHPPIHAALSDLEKRLKGN